jgi:hypothetical protein
MRVELSEFNIIIDKLDDGTVSFESGLCEQIPDNTICSTVEDLILAHFEAGVNILHPDYREGIKKFIKELKKPSAQIT